MAASKKKNVYPDGVKYIAVYPYEAKDNPTVAFVKVTVREIVNVETSEKTYAMSIVEFDQHGKEV